MLWLIFLVPLIILTVKTAPLQLFEIMQQGPFALSQLRSFSPSPFLWTYLSCAALFYFVEFLIYFTYVLSTRASLEAKNFSYYRLYITKTISRYTLMQLTLALIGAPLVFILTIIGKILSMPNFIGIVVSYIFSIIALLACFIFFDFDAMKLLQVLKKAISLFIYFFPLFLAFSIFFMILIAPLIALGWGFLILRPHYLVAFGLFLCAPCLYSLIFALLTYSCYATLYVKVKHAYPNLFFA
jgi:hypothetical protein